MRFLSFLRQRLATPRQRIIFALLLSLFLHLVLLGTTHVEPPPTILDLPPLQAKLEALPPISETETHATATPPDNFSAPENAILPSSAPLPASAVADTESPPKAEETVVASAPSAEPSSAVLASSAVEVAHETVAASAVVSAVVSAPESAAIAPETPVVAAEAQRPPLPKQAQLKFNVFQGQGNFKAGEAIHTLQIKDGHYVLKADIHTTGLARMLKSYRMVQTSSGSASQTSLKPDVLTEEITDSKGTQRNRTEFDWDAQRIHFSLGGEANLPAHAQDILSILYQFPGIKPGMEIVTIYIATTKRAEAYRFEVGMESQLSTPLGALKTVHFRKLHKANEEGLEIWFAQEYRLLPVKIRHIDSSGNVAGEAVISDIRLAD